MTRADQLTPIRASPPKAVTCIAGDRLLGAGPVDPFSLVDSACGNGPGARSALRSGAGSTTGPLVAYRELQIMCR